MNPGSPRRAPDAEALLGGDALDDVVTGLKAAVSPLREVGGWATVELDRAEVELAARLADLGPPAVEAAPEDRVLGARSRMLRFADGRLVALLEPSTEGRLAGALARHGEGYLVRYLVVDRGGPERARRAGFGLGAERPGPLGPELLVVDGPRDGPFLILVPFD